ncbi:hypothetical protein [Agrobacterium vitis]|uniref:Uncharacterized protein n=1 Tax=Agrobacterium vitis TaxID=373 RepID=A0AAE2RFI3_AGRVI|nr:hypothetical protein [Agrobacterium vitis]MBF2715740.1 hypothetical protein [Agrobacterium vitis]MUZ63461.1 hypothetical protein [Agrobacterium vitis]
MPLAQPSHDRKPNVSAAVMADCAELAYIPAGVDRDDEYRLWGQDRKALADCRALNAAKAATINSLQGN